MTASDDKARSTAEPTGESTLPLDDGEIHVRQDAPQDAPALLLIHGTAASLRQLMSQAFSPGYKIPQAFVDEARGIRPTSRIRRGPPRPSWPSPRTMPQRPIEAGRSRAALLSRAVGVGAVHDGGDDDRDLLVLD
jgi:hypothetical protein